jgi:NADPH:quinone reductase-like Zn-dependent oxidoreductase/quercetin dioxygenase-like cupin family protein
MKAAVIREYGEPGVLHLEDLPEPEVPPDKVLIRVAAASINPIDTQERAGQVKDWHPTFPAILGWDVAGRVVATGSEVKGFAEGDEVFAWAYRTYAHLCAVPAAVVAKVPTGIALETAAALPLVGTTGSQLISLASGLAAGQTVLVSGALGGVGRSAVFTAKDRGAKVIAAVLRRQLDAAAALGADQVVALDDADAFGALAKVDVVANTVRGETADRLLTKVRPGGTFASATGVPPSAPQHPSVRVVAFKSKQSAETLRYVIEAVRSRKLSIPIAHRLPLEDAAKGHSLVEEVARARYSCCHDPSTAMVDRVTPQSESAFRSVLPDEIEWKPFAAFPPSARLAIVVGDPAAPGPYVIRVKVPGGVRLMPHRHPENRIYTVISGVFYIGLGEKFDRDALRAYPPGSVVVLPGGTFHSTRRNPASTSHRSRGLARSASSIGTPTTIPALTTQREARKGRNDGRCAPDDDSGRELFVPSLCPDSVPRGGTRREGAGSNGSDLSKRFREFGG